MQGPRARRREAGLRRSRSPCARRRLQTHARAGRGRRERARRERDGRGREADRTRGRASPSRPACVRDGSCRSRRCSGACSRRPGRGSRAATPPRRRARIARRNRRSLVRMRTVLPAVPWTASFPLREGAPLRTNRARAPRRSPSLARISPAAQDDGTASRDAAGRTAIDAPCQARSRSTRCGRTPRLRSGEPIAPLAVPSRLRWRRRPRGRSIDRPSASRRAAS